MKKKWALVLGSGGARGLAHIGVIKSLEERGMMPDIVVGSSMGAFIGLLYASGMSGDEMIKRIEKVTTRGALMQIADLAGKEGFVSGVKVVKMIEDMIGKTRIEDLRIPFAAVATNMKTAEVKVFAKGDAAMAVRASSAIPLVFEPMTIDGEKYVDGGVSNPVPVEVAREMGAEVVVAVNLDALYFANEKAKKVSGKMGVLVNAYYQLRHHLSRIESKKADVVIEPKMKMIFDLEFGRGKEAIEAGWKTTEDRIEEIKGMIA